MAARSMKDASVCDVELLLHPELLAQDFMRLILREKGLRTRGCDSRDHLTELYLRHVVPRPQRSLPDSRWGRRMRHSRESQTGRSDSNDHSRKRPLIVFDSSSSSHSGPVKLKKPGGNNLSAGATDRLKPPPAANLSNPIRRLSGTAAPSSSPASSNNTSLKPADNTDTTQSSEVKKKIQHVTWP